MGSFSARGPVGQSIRHEPAPPFCERPGESTAAHATSFFVVLFPWAPDAGPKIEEWRLKNLSRGQACMRASTYAIISDVALIVLDTSVFVSALISPTGASREVLRRCLEKRCAPGMRETTMSLS